MLVPAHRWGRTEYRGMHFRELPGVAQSDWHGPIAYSEVNHEHQLTVFHFLADSESVSKKLVLLPLQALGIALVPWGDVRLRHTFHGGERLEAYAQTLVEVLGVSQRRPAHPPGSPAQIVAAIAYGFRPRTGQRERP